MRLATRRDLFRFAAPRARVAVVEPDLCTAWGGDDCRLCSAVCPRPGAISWTAGGGPVIRRELCDACGVCVSACEAGGSRGAIRLASRVA